MNQIISLVANIYGTVCMWLNFHNAIYLKPRLLNYSYVAAMWLNNFDHPIGYVHEATPPELIYVSLVAMQLNSHRRWLGMTV